MKPVLLLLLLLPTVSFANTCKQINQIDTAPYHADVKDLKVTFLVVDLKKNNCWAINKNGLKQRHSPFSTFKIPHSLIALETGAVNAIDTLVEWDSEKYPAKSFWPATWKQPQTLTSAFQRSAVWFYQDLVPKIDPKQYEKWLARFSYGNKKFTVGSKEFWLDNELTISPLEQVNFLVCFLKTGCGVTAKNRALYETIALAERGEGFALYAKTGAGPIDASNMDGAFEGWYVGYVRDKNAQPTSAFALHVTAENFSSIRDFRKAFSLQILSDFGFLKE